MLIQQNFIYKQNYSKYNTQLSFKSNREQEAMLRALREAEATEMKRRYARFNELFEYEVKDSSCHNMAQFTLNFACAIENNSEHNLDEFFASEIKAAELRKKLTHECQKNSLEIRREIQSLPVFKDPALALISANEMKEFVPDDEFFNDKRFKPTIQAAKKIYTQAVKLANKDKFNDYEKGLIEELAQIIDKSSSLDFGEIYEQKLAMLIESTNKRKIEAERVFVKQKSVIPKILKRWIKI